MKKIGLTVYGFNIKDNHDNYLLLNDKVNGNFFIEKFCSYVDKIKKAYTDDGENETVFSYNEVEKKTITNEHGQDVYNILYCKVKTGEYGIQSELVDSKTGIVTHTRTDKEADVMPFGFCIAVPCCECNRGVIILQSIGRSGIKVVIEKKLRQFLNTIDSKFKINIGAIVPRTYINHFFNSAELKTIRLIRYNIPDDIAERIGLNLGTQATEERIIKYPEGFVMNKRAALDEWLEGKRMYDSVVQLPDFDADDIKLEFKTGRSTTKTISLKNVDNLIITEDITDEVTLIDGHPGFESLKGSMNLAAKEYLILMGLIVEE